MVRYVDPDAGFATFTQGRSLCVRLQGTVDARTARAVERRLLHHRDAVRLRFECSSVRDIDPSAARILSTAARGWRGRGEGRGVEVHNRPRPSAPTTSEARPLHDRSPAGRAVSAPGLGGDAAELRRELRPPDLRRTRPAPDRPAPDHLRRTHLRRTRFQNSEIPGLPRAFRRAHLPSGSH